MGIRKLVKFFYLFAAFLTFTSSSLAQKIIKYKALVSSESTVVQMSASEENTETRNSYKLRRGDKELQLESPSFNVNGFMSIIRFSGNKR